MRLVEAKAGRTVTPGDAARMQRLAATWRGQRAPRGGAELILAHRPARVEPPSHAVAPGVRDMPWQEFINGLL